MESTQPNTSAREILKSFEGKDPATDFYQDSEFPTDITSICPDTKHRNYNKIFSKAQWLRYHEIYKPGTSNELFDKIDPSNIVQGIAGAAPFVSVLAALSEFPDRIKSIFNIQEKNPYGVYSVTFYINGAPREVIIDDHFPCYEWGKPLFSHSKANELWVLLIEKAWAKLFGSYTATEEGEIQEIFECLTGTPCTSIKAADLDQIVKNIPAWLKRGYILTATTSSSIKNAAGLAPAHTYPLIGVFQAGSHRVFKFRNPWGKIHWKGDFSEEWSGWTPELEKAVGYSKTEPGVFFMSAKDFEKHFVSIDCCFYNDKAHRKALNLKQEGKKASYFEFELKEPSEFCAAISQLNKKLQKDTYAYSPVDLFLMKQGDNSTLKKIATGDKFTQKGRSTIYLSDSHELKLEPGKYLLKAKLNGKGEEDSNEFSLVTYSEKPIKLQPVEKKETNTSKNFFIGLASAVKEKKDIGHECTFVHGWEKRFLFFVVENKGEKTCMVKLGFDDLKGMKLAKPFNISEDAIAIIVPPKTTECAYAGKVNFDIKPNVKWSLTNELQTEEPEETE